MPDSRHVAWIKQQFRNRPDLEYQDLARHLGRAKPMVTHLLNGSRRIQAGELEKIEEFFGKKFDTDEADAPYIIPIGYKIGLAWYEDGNGPPSAMRNVASVIDPPIQGTQVAFELEINVPELNLSAGGIVIAVTIDKRVRLQPKMKVVYTRRRSGLVQYGIGDVARVAGDKMASPIAIVIETRQPVR